MPDRPESDLNESQARSGKTQALDEILESPMSRILLHLEDVPDKTCEVCGMDYYGKLKTCPECERSAEQAAQEIERKRARLMEAREMVRAAFGLHAQNLAFKPWGVQESEVAEVELQKPSATFYLFGKMSTENDRLKFAAAIARRWLECNSVSDRENVKAINWIHAPAWWDNFAWRSLEIKMELPVLVLENVGSGFTPGSWLVLTTLLERRLSQPRRLSLMTSRFSPDQLKALDPKCSIEGLQAMLRIVLPGCCKIEI
jgi:hypothetical protein